MLEEFNAIAFDLRMANLSLEGREGGSGHQWLCSTVVHCQIIIVFLCSKNYCIIMLSAMRFLHYILIRMFELKILEKSICSILPICPSNTMLLCYYVVILLSYCVFLLYYFPLLFLLYCYLVVLLSARVRS